jgi:hypothetical protein
MLEVMPQRTPILNPPHKLLLLPILTQHPAIIQAVLKKDKQRFFSSKPCKEEEQGCII